jgi:hypothetical protein
MSWILGDPFGRPARKDTVSCFAGLLFTMIAGSVWPPFTAIHDPAL